MPPSCVENLYYISTIIYLFCITLQWANKERRTRLRWTISYKSMYFVHPSLELVTLFKGEISIVSNNPYEALVSKGAAGQLVKKSQGQKRQLITLFHKEYSSFCYDLFYLCLDVHCNNKKMVKNFRQKNGIKIVQKCAKRKGILDWLLYRKISESR